MNRRLRPEGPRRSTVVVTDAGRSSAVAIIRSLGRAGWRVLALDSERWSPGFFSKYTDRSVRTVSPVEQPTAFASHLADIAHRESVDLIIPVTDNAILPLASRRSDFPERTYLAIPTDRQLQAVRDKAETIALAERLGIPVPKSEVADTLRIAAKYCNQLGWPVVVKPRYSREMLGPSIITNEVQYANSVAELAHIFESARGPTGFLLQEYWEGEGCGVELLAENGFPRAHFQHKRLREVPPSGGAGSCRQGVATDPTLYAYAVSLMRELSWTGLAMVEYKVGRRGAALMEINGRIWGSLPLAVASGVDFPLLMAQLLTRGESGDVGHHPYVTGLKRRNLELELTWAASVITGRHPHYTAMDGRRRGLALLVELLVSVNELDNYDARDIRPLASELIMIATKFARRLSVRAHG